MWRRRSDGRLQERSDSEPEPGDWLHGIDRVVGTMTGPQRRRVRTVPAWARFPTVQVHARDLPVCWKEDLVPILGEENMIQEPPEAFNRVLEEQCTWKSRKSR